MSIPKVIRDQVWYKQLLFYNSNVFILNGSASPFKKVFLEENNAKMTLVQGHSCSRKEHPFAVPSDFFPLFKSEFSDKPTISIIALVAILAFTFAAVPAVPKYTEEDL